MPGRCSPKARNALTYQVIDQRATNTRPYKYTTFRKKISTHQENVTLTSSILDPCPRRNGGQLEANCINRLSLFHMHASPWRHGVYILGKEDVHCGRTAEVTGRRHE